VDDPAQLTFLREEQCDQVQGFLISPPLENAEFIEFLRAHNAQLKPDNLVLDVTAH
jgi:EAL domain-containing protein (putative c-di-GMP-specific phosphodiesterase class I)